MDEQTKLIINFEPLSDGKELIDATFEYKEIWKSESEKIIAMFEKVSGSKFIEKEIKVVVDEGISRSGRSESDPMRLRASYSVDVKKATLIHELGHRFLFQFENKKHGLDAHQILFLILYDIWAELYGKEFADKQVAIESARKGVYDYETTWKWALALGKEGREKMFGQIRKMSALSFIVDNDQKQVLLKKISEIIDQFEIKSILDIGAGHPILAIPLSKKVVKYFGIETEPNRVKQLKEAGLNVIEGRFPEVVLSDTYDLVLCSHSIPEQVDEYHSFFAKAWDLVTKNGWLVIITFKGVKDDLEDLTNQLRENWADDDKLRYEEMIKILSAFGEVQTDKIVSHSNSEDIEQVANLLSFSIGGTDEEKKSYREKLENILEEKYKVGGKYVFPHEHLVLMIQKL